MKELSISGGGVKGIAFVGALQYLESMNELNDLEIISGSSIGAFIATCIVVGYKINELISVIFEYDFSVLKDTDITNIFKRKSIFKGEELKKFYKYIISKKSENITLKELYEKSKIKLIITSVCINTKSLKYLSHETEPDLDILTAVYMSSAIPGVFPPVNYKNKLYVDGGVLNNLPIISQNSWAISSKSENNEIENSKIDFFNFFTSILKIIYQENQKINHKKIIYVDINKIEVTSFNINKDDKLTLLKLGYNSAKNYFIK